MIKFKMDVMEALKSKGYNTTRIRNEKLIPEGTLTKIRNNNGMAISTATLNTICKILNKQPGQILEFVKDQEPEAAADQE